MPNWCTNELTISGDDNSRAKACKFISDAGGNVDFNKLVPMPQALHDGQSVAGYNDWYDWSIAHWGVKWNADTIQQLEDYGVGKSVVLFNTPWGPPDIWFSKLKPHAVELGVCFELKWVEPINVIGGGIVINSDGTISDTTYDQSQISEFIYGDQLKLVDEDTLTYIGVE